MTTKYDSWFPAVLEDLRDFAKKNGLLKTASNVEAAYVAFQIETFENQSVATRVPSSRIAECKDGYLNHTINTGRENERVVVMDDYKASRQIILGESSGERN